MSAFSVHLRKFFSAVQMFTQAPFSLGYARLLESFGRVSHWLGFRLHQVCKVLLELTSRFPDCSVQPLKPDTMGEVCFGVCWRGPPTEAMGSSILHSWIFEDQRSSVLINRRILRFG